MRGMGRVFQAASTVDAILRDDMIEDAAAAGLRSLFVGFESLSPRSLLDATRSRISAATMSASSGAWMISAS
jgi:hypothetical protein